MLRGVGEAEAQRRNHGSYTAKELLNGIGGARPENKAWMGGIKEKKTKIK